MCLETLLSAVDDGFTERPDDISAIDLHFISSCMMTRAPMNAVVH